jgi:hypothetical protein
LERTVYERILSSKTTRLEGTVAEIGEKYGLSPTHAAAFLDGIHECVDGLPELSEIEEDTPISVEIEYGRLYKQMVEYNRTPVYPARMGRPVYPRGAKGPVYGAEKVPHGCP